MRKLNTKNTATLFAVLAAALYAINIPLSKLLLQQVEPTMMAAFLYLGAGIGMLLYRTIKNVLGKGERKEPLTRKELPYTVAMVVLDIAAPILLMLGISKTNSANVSLLNNFEIVATSLIALVVFKEVISKRLFFWARQFDNRFLFGREPASSTFHFSDTPAGICCIWNEH